MTTIHVTTTKDPFARVLKSMLEDERLSWKAKGIMAYLLGKKDGWKLRAKDIENHGPDGKAAVRSALKELLAFGYLETCVRAKFVEYSLAASPGSIKSKRPFRA